MGTVLLIDDDQNFRETLAEVFTGEGYKVVQASDGEIAIGLMQSTPPDVALCDWRMAPMGGLDVLRFMQRNGLIRSVPVIVLTAYGDAESTVQAMQAGAYDFLVKPVDLDTVMSTVNRALEHMSLQRNLERLQSERFRDGRIPVRADVTEDEGEQLIGRSPVWIDAFKKVGQVAQTNLSVLLEGATGTGKEMVARVLHRNSERSKGPFVAVNCAAIPEDLVESELFGHERGAFTGAGSQRMGSFEQADKGTIFLDEIGEMPLAIQPKLLRVLQEKTFQRVGGSRPLQANVRVIAATNRSLADEVERGTFRADLYYRLNSYHVQLPLLRDRRTDILLLTEYFLERFARRTRTPVPALAVDAKAIIESYDYPGNVRELEHLMNQLAVEAAGRPITAQSVQDALRKAASHRSEDWRQWETLPFHESVARWERHLIERALELAAGNKSDAARRLGIQRRLLYEKLQQFSSAD